MVEVLDVGRSTNQTKSWSLFGFLYGTFPSAPSVAIFAGKYGIEEQLVWFLLVTNSNKHIQWSPWDLNQFLRHQIGSSHFTVSISELDQHSWKIGMSMHLQRLLQGRAKSKRLLEFYFLSQKKLQAHCTVYLECHVWTEGYNLGFP